MRTKKNSICSRLDMDRYTEQMVCDVATAFLV